MLHSRQRHSTSCGTLNSNAHTKGGRRMSRCFASAYQLLLSITLFNLEQGSTAHTLQHPFLSLDFRKPNVYCYAVPENHYICPVMHTKEMDMGWRDTEIHVQTAQSIISSCLFFRKTDYLAYHFAGL